MYLRGTFYIKYLRSAIIRNYQHISVNNQLLKNHLKTKYFIMNTRAVTREGFYEAIKPSQWVFIKQYAMYGIGAFLCLTKIVTYPIFAVIGLLFCAFKIFEKYMTVKNSSFLISQERLVIKSATLWGINVYDIERWRIRDVELYQPLLFQIFKIGNLRINSSQYDKQELTLFGVENPMYIREIISSIARGSINEGDYEAVRIEDLPKNKNLLR